jgi:hypothetical protein
MRLALGRLGFISLFGVLGCSAEPFEGFPPLATDQRGVTGIAVDGSFVYWTLSSGAVRRVSVTGGAVETVVEGLEIPNQIAVDDTHVYWTTLTGAIGRAPKAGGPAFTLAEGEGEGSHTIAGLQVDDTHVYWSRSRSDDQDKRGDVKRGPKGGGTPEVLASSLTKPFFSLAMVGSSLFWNVDGTRGPDGTIDGAVREVAVDGGSERLFAGEIISPRSLATNGQHICWTSLDPDALTLDPTSSAQIITRADLDGTGVRRVASDLENLEAFVADDATIYYAYTSQNEDEAPYGAVASISIDGGEPYRFARGVPGKTSIAVDQTSIYWAHQEGDALLTMPKP